MEKKYLIVGHGIAGCVLALTFLRNDIPFRLIGMDVEGEASMASSGLITPVTGRRFVKSWMIDEFIASALNFYRWTEELIGQQYFFEVEITRFLSHPEAEKAWEFRSQDPTYQKYISTHRKEELDRLQKPYGILTGGYRLDTPGWITAIRSYLLAKGLYEESYISAEMDTSEYHRIIYATGAIPPIFSSGLIPNKGEALIVKLPDWKLPGIVKNDVYFIPLLEENMFWVGSYYLRWPEDPHPTAEGKQTLVKAINQFYDGSFVIREHVAGIRPTVDDRRPLIGPVSEDMRKYIFNGMGTKGTSLAPYWADQLVSHFISDTSIDRIVHPGRYKTQQSG